MNGLDHRMSFISKYDRHFMILVSNESWRYLLKANDSMFEKKGYFHKFVPCFVGVGNNYWLNDTKQSESQAQSLSCQWDVYYDDIFTYKRSIANKSSRKIWMILIDWMIDKHHEQQ